MREQQQDELPRGGEGEGGQGAACLTNGNGLLHRKEEQRGGLPLLIVHEVYMILLQIRLPRLLLPHML